MLQGTTASIAPLCPSPFTAARPFAADTLPAPKEIASAGLRGISGSRGSSGSRAHAGANTAPPHLGAGNRRLGTRKRYILGWGRGQGLLSGSRRYFLLGYPNEMVSGWACAPGSKQQAASSKRYKTAATSAAEKKGKSIPGHPPCLMGRGTPQDLASGPSLSGCLLCPPRGLSGINLPDTGTGTKQTMSTRNPPSPEASSRPLQGKNPLGSVPFWRRTVGGCTAVYAPSEPVVLCGPALPVRSRLGPFREDPESAPSHPARPESRSGDQVSRVKTSTFNGFRPRPRSQCGAR